ncbi:hypothetical protein CARUB_v10001272mg [Capsella rubella]|uniref:F-box domain-containing protein n=1 Tax=Capsella rubella TaxID=81985 RepID=R0GVL6_9BRAS|nr:hypothetical protein CARUB_v10001272mg [Capsella rubella]
MNKEESPLPTSFLSLPDDVTLSCLTHVSRFHYPTLSLVSKGFRSLIASPDLEAIRSSMGEPESYLCVCLDNTNPTNIPCWFTVSPIPKQKLKPIPSFPQQQQYPQSPSVVSIGSEIYIIGGFVKGKRSRRVSVFDCRSHQWRRLPKMRLPRAAAAAGACNGKIRVMGGCRSKNVHDWEEFCDPKTNTWESKTLNFTIQQNMSICMGGKRYQINGLKLNLKTDVCFVDIENELCLISVSNRKLFWHELKPGCVSCEVNGLEQLSSHCFILVARSGGGARVTVWWKSVMKILDLQQYLLQDCHSTGERCETQICCAEIVFERRGLQELWGFVQWSKIVFTVDGFDPSSDFFLNYAVVTY